MSQRPMHVCPECDGSGERDAWPDGPKTGVTCETCSGEGRVPAGDIDIVREALRDSEWAYSCSPKRPRQDSTEWAQWRAETIVAALAEARHENDAIHTLERRLQDVKDALDLAPTNEYEQGVVDGLKDAINILKGAQCPPG